ncbi:MAG: hypothetical protein N2C14_29210, partial [Planctomycetales bacterium]
MRLTLRVLLAYRDGMLNDEQSREVESKIDDSPMAQELRDRIHRLTTSRETPAPPVDEEFQKLDAGLAAQYLDCEISPDQMLGVEQVCMTSDPHLAEIADCHQILFKALTQPAEIPPSARARVMNATAAALGNHAPIAEEPTNQPADAVSESAVSESAVSESTASESTASESTASESTASESTASESTVSEST